jgi:hypothetical protein
MKEFLEQKLREKEKQLNHRKEVFKVVVENEIDTGNFERNAIADLTLMIELKTEIKELKNIISVYDAYHQTEKGGADNDR